MKDEEEEEDDRDIHIMKVELRLTPVQLHAERSWRATNNRVK